MRKGDFVEILGGEHKGSVVQVLLVEDLKIHTLVTVSHPEPKPFPDANLCFKAGNLAFHHREQKKGE